MPNGNRLLSVLLDFLFQDWIVKLIFKGQSKGYGLRDQEWYRLKHNINSSI